MKVNEVISPDKRKPQAKRALLLFSGGLDSTLAGMVLKNQGIDVVAVNFKSPFFGEKKALWMAKKLDWPLLVANITKEQLKIVENPKHGFGKNMNPCIDCHAQMIKLAARLLPKYDAKFVATGEVLGERPKSQNPKALKIVEQESGLEGYVLRPLSAKLLKPTVPEKEGWVDRESLFSISGRSRKPQMKLAKKLGLKEYPLPGGGCLLTDPGFSARLRKLLSWRGKLLVSDIELVKNGRHFFFGDDWVVIGRDERENKQLEKNHLNGDILITTIEKPGPITIVRSLKDKPGNETIKVASLLTIRYSQARRDNSASVEITKDNQKKVETFTFDRWKKYLEGSYIPPF